jgi:N-acyl-D-amino-acid deacylase
MPCLRPRSAALMLVACLAVVASPEGAQAPRYDIVIRGGTLIDGSGAPGRRGDVGIKGDQIVAVGAVPNPSGSETIDATGLAVAPGFIDVHTHADDLAATPRAENFVRMGVTSVVAGNCGSSALDAGEALTTVRRSGVAINFATLIGHNTVRQAVMGTARRDATVSELAKMKSLVWRAIADGAVGFSTGLQYVPGTYANHAEILELARVAGNAGGLYASHLRNEGTELEKAVEEAIRIGEQAMCRVQISHLKVDSPNRWGASVRALALIDAARARGVDVKSDQYAYTAASSTLGIRFPAWVLEGGSDAAARRLNHAATWERVKTEMRALFAERGLADLSFAVVASFKPDPSLNGLSMKQVALKLQGSESVDAQLESARQLMIRGGASMIYHFMSDEDVDRIMKHPQVAIASDSSVLTAGQGVPHPRGYGNNVRVLGEYVRRRHVISLEEAIRKMTSLPAEHFKFERRGLLKPGYVADITIFDPQVARDAATFERPHAPAAGVPYVLVNGVVVIRKGEHTNAYPGQVLTTRAPK